MMHFEEVPFTTDTFNSFHQKKQSMMFICYYAGLSNNLFDNKVINCLWAASLAAKTVSDPVVWSFMVFGKACVNSMD